MSILRTLSIGTSAEGTVGNAAGKAIASLLSDNGVLRVEVRPTGGQSVLLPQINNGQLDMGIANVLEIAEASSGAGVFAGRRQTGIRSICVLFPNRTGIFVRADSDIRGVADLRGRRLTYGFASMTSMTRLVLAILANGGLTLADVNPVSVTNANDGIEALMSGAVDACYSAPGAPMIADASRRMGGIRMLPLLTEPGAVASMKRVVPESFALETFPGPALSGIGEPTHALAYDLSLLASLQLEDDVVYRVAAILAEYGSTLAKSLADFRAFRPENMVRPVPCEYHAGAMRYYREHGLWPSA
jgi:hypothetical protein